MATRGDYMRWAREDCKGYSQKELAKLAGVTSNNLSLWERDKFTPSIESVAKLAKALDTTIDDYIGA